VLTSVNGDRHLGRPGGLGGRSGQEAAAPSVNLRIIRAGRPTIVPLKIAP
jgi:serine protease Do